MPRSILQRPNLLFFSLHFGTKVLYSNFNFFFTFFPHARYSVCRGSILHIFFVSRHFFLFTDKSASPSTWFCPFLEAKRPWFQWFILCKVQQLVIFREKKKKMSSGFNPIEVRLSYGNEFWMRKYLEIVQFSSKSTMKPF